MREKRDGHLPTSTIENEHSGQRPAVAINLSKILIPHLSLNASRSWWRQAFVLRFPIGYILPTLERVLVSLFCLFRGNRELGRTAPFLFRPEAMGVDNHKQSNANLSTVNCISIQ